jgi:hypothetical protein
MKPLRGPTPPRAETCWKKGFLSIKKRRLSISNLVREEETGRRRMILGIFALTLLVGISKMIIILKFFHYPCARVTSIIIFKLKEDHSGGG